MNPRRRLTRIVLGCLAALLAPLAVRADDAPASSAERMVPWGDVRIPMMRPSWGEDPLAAITARIQSGDPIAARALLERLVAEYNDRLILPAGADPETLVRVPRPDFVLREWFASLDSETDLLLSSGELLRPATKPHGASPLLWHPTLRDPARRRFEAALEEDDWRTALLIAGSPNAPALADSLRRWLEARTAEQLAGVVTTTTPTFELPQRLHHVYRLPLDSTRDFKPTPADPRNVQGVKLRRMPLAGIEPLLSRDSVTLQSGSRCFALGLGERPRIRWQVGSPPRVKLVPALQDERTQVVSSHDLLVVRRRRPDWAETMSAFTLAHYQRTLEQGLYNDLVLLRRHAADEQPRLLGRRFLDYSAGAGILVHAGRIYVPLWRGWSHQELALGVLDGRSGEELWVRTLGTRTRSWHSHTDLRDKLPHASVVPYRDELIVVHAFGWVARLGAVRGDDRGVIRYPQWSWEGLLSGSGNQPARLRMLYAPRPRYPSAPVFVPATDDSPPLLVVLPPDARHLFAIDLESWRIAWRHPTTWTTFLLGVRRRGDGERELLLFDAGVAVADSAASVRAIDPRSGRVVRDPSLLELTAAPTLPAPEDDPTAMILRGMPRLVGDALWVPTTVGLEVWNTAEVEPGARVSPDRVLAWPPTSRGGTLTPLPDGRILCLSRGDATRGVTSFLEIFAAKKSD